MTATGYCLNSYIHYPGHDQSGFYPLKMHLLCKKCQFNKTYILSNFQYLPHGAILPVFIDFCQEKSIAAPCIFYQKQLNYFFRLFLPHFCDLKISTTRNVTKGAGHVLARH